MFKYYNANPTGKSVGDCVIRSISVTTGTDYAEIKRALNKHKKLIGAKSFNSNRNPNKYVEDILGAEKIVFKKKMTAGEFCDKFQKGSYILDMDEHWSSVVNGTIYDTWDTSLETVNFAYKIKADNCKAPDISQQKLCYCCTSEQISDTESRIRIYDGNGTFVERHIPIELVKGYVRCLEDQHYTYVEI